MRYLDSGFLVPGMVSKVPSNWVLPKFYPVELSISKVHLAGEKAFTPRTFSSASFLKLEHQAGSWGATLAAISYPAMVLMY